MTSMAAPGALIVLIVLGTLAVLTIGEICRELHTFKVTRYSIESDKLPAGAEELRLVFLSDLHNREYGPDNERLYQAVRAQRPDLILIGGDMLVGKAGVSFEPALRFVRRLPGICPVYYANGNHEQRMKENPGHYMDCYEKYRRKLEQAGVIFLENEFRTVQAGQGFLELRALELPLNTYRKMKRSRVSAGDVDSLTGRRKDDSRGREKEWFSVLLAHNPAYMDAYMESGADLVLSGHLHGGVVRIPGVGGVISPQMFLFPRYSGEMTRKGGQTVIVSRGLGTHSINVRLFNTPELVLISIRPPGA